MDLWMIGVVLVVGGAIVLAKRAGRVSAEQVQEWRARGAVVLDVRTTGEFGRGHLAKARNVPLDVLAAQVAEAVPDQTTPILVHCASGGRSALATRQLKRLGYQTVANLGGYGRAAKLLGEG